MNHKLKNIKTSTLSSIKYFSGSSFGIILERLIAPLEGSAISRSLFVRALAGVYFIAVLSWWVQMQGLVGSDGLLPAANYLERVQAYSEQQGMRSFFIVPSLLLFNCSDLFMHALCLLGVFLAVMVAAGFLQGAGLALLWLVYLSLVTTGGVFMSFQWDMLLLEMGFLAIFIAPWKMKVSWREPDLNVSRGSWFLLRWLVFRLLFFAGYVKLTSGDESWWDGTAMLFHYQTQPLPTWTAWWMQQLPDGLNRFTCLPMLVIEMLLPFFIFMGRRLRLFAAIAISSLMLLIMVTGNYTYFNILTMVLCLSLVDDRYWPCWCLQKLRIQSRDLLDYIQERAGSPMRLWSRLDFVLRVGGGLVLLLISGVVIVDQLVAGGTMKRNPMPRWSVELRFAVQPFRLVSGYGLFRVMTKQRPEIIFEGSRDGRTWEEYRLKYKPNKLTRRPRFVAPHQPRLDWQLWFAALEGQYHPKSRNAPWMNALMLGLLQGSPQVLDFFEYQPFRNRPPKYVRAKLYRYEFTSIEERRDSGQWWKRKTMGLYFPEISKR